jgi:NADH-quinone oxidoreductase subunit N
MQIPDSSVLWPDVLFMMATVVAWLVDTFGSDRRERSRVAYTIVLCSAALSALGYAMLMGYGQELPRYFFSNMVVIDSFALAMKLFIAVGLAASLIYSRPYLEAQGAFSGDFLLLAMFSAIGQLVMISGHNVLMLYLGLELMSLSLYAMIALRRDDVISSEASIKYYVLGALASGFLLYGISMLYGATGSLDLADIFHAITSGQCQYSILSFALVFIVVAVAFKLGVAPFHMWVPDVYHGASTPAVLLTGGIPKLTAFAWGWRFLVGGLLPLAIDWQKMLIVPAVVSLLIGNFAGIVQKNIKRLLAYSAIANMGLVLLALRSGIVDGLVLHAQAAYGAAMFYGVVYLLTILGVFGVIMSLSRQGFEIAQIEDLKGLGQRHPLLAAVMAIMMFSLTGIPPLAGFYAKFAVIEAVVQAHLVGVAVLAVLASLCGAFYYLRIVKTMYFDAPDDENADQTAVFVPRDVRFSLIANSAVVLVLGIFPGPLISLCAQAIHHASIA